ncbi:hypothetical protein SPBRAN_561 [uncultured Candidatus Thioglobus sp.]|nr:hypothetical protein SPBRAN_561 [uncultured Candidatus Thioglobus sp.]
MCVYSITRFLPLLFLLCGVFGAVHATPVQIRLVYVGAETHASLLGAKQGLIEANLQGQFLGQEYQLDRVNMEVALTKDFSAYIAIIAAVGYADFLRLSETFPNMPVFNVSLADDRLRTLCLRNALHVMPSDRMLSDAVTQWQTKKPQSQVVPQAWHKDFIKFAARDLNKRFLKNQLQAMDDYAWAGWAAMKMVSDSVAREKLTSALEMLDYLQQDLAFDGQKGARMNFRETGQLRQLIILVQDGKIVAEAPVRGVAQPPILDSLGALHCNK